MMRESLGLLVWGAILVLVRGDTYAVPSTTPAGAAALEAAPVGVSFEFFDFPSYFTNVTATTQCLQNFEELTGTWPPIRIGGTTQDRATYVASQSAEVVYSVAAATAAPTALSFGPSFMELAGKYSGSVVLGLNRGHNDIENTIAAAESAKSSMSNLLSIELGNEPEYWLSASQPIAVAAGTWTAAIDAESQDNWDIQVGSALSLGNIIQAGNSLSNPPGWGAAELIATENSTVQQYVKDYAHHNYPGGTVTSLMSHSGIVSNLAVYKADVAAAKGVGKDYIWGETNSVSGGGASTVSPLFGAGLWTMDYVLQSTASNISRAYFHHGTIGLCYYCWWGRYDMGAPYYGAYTATAALAGGSYITALDNGTSSDGVYVIYDSAKVPIKVLLYNSVFYDGTGTRGTQSFELTGLLSGTGGIGDVAVQSKRLTAPSANSRVDEGSVPTFGGQTFANVTCVIDGTETFESTSVTAGVATFSVGDSEALLVYLDSS